MLEKGKRKRALRRLQLNGGGFNHRKPYVEVEILINF